MSVAGASAPSSPSSRQSRAGPLWGNSPLKRGAGPPCTVPPATVSEAGRSASTASRASYSVQTCARKCAMPVGRWPSQKWTSGTSRLWPLFPSARSLWWLLSIVMCNHRAPAFAPSRYIVHYHMYVISVPVGVPMQQRGRAKRVRIGYSVGYQPQVCEAIPTLTRGEYGWARRQPPPSTRPGGVEKVQGPPSLPRRRLT